jgi:hypothetical protein
MADEVVVEARFRDLMSRPVEKATETLKKLDRAFDRVREGAGTKLGRALDKTRNRLSKVDRAIGRVVRGAARMARTVGGAMATGVRRGTIAIGALATAAVFAANSLVGLAADATETQSKFDTVFADSSDAVDAWVTDLHNRFGIATADLRDAASTFGVFGKAAGLAANELPDFSTSLTQAGLDLASFYNVDPGEAFISLRSGLAGEAEPLRKFGIFLSDATLKAKAATLGLTGELTEAQKVMVRHQLIMDGLGDAAGDLTRTQDSLANQQREASGRWEEIRTVVGTALIPTYERLYGLINDRLGPVTERLSSSIQDLVEPARASERSLEGWAGAADYVLGTGGRLLEFVRTGRDRFDDFRPTIDKLSDVTTDLSTIWSDLLQPAFANVQDILPFVVSPLTLLDDIIGFVADNTDTLVPIVVALTAAYATQKAIVLGANAVMAASNAIRFITTASTSGLAAAQTAATTSTGALAAGTGVLNAVMSANPIGIVVVALAALAAGIYVAYQRSETFRNVVATVWDWLKRAGAVVTDLFLRFTPLGQSITFIRDNFDTLRDAVRSVVRWLKQAWEWAGKAVNKVGGVLSAVPGGSLISKIMPGDTATPRTRGGDGAAHANLAGTLGRFDTITRGRSGFRVTSGVRDFALGSPGSDHARGRAIDVQGAFTGRLAQQWRQAGGFAEHHGNGAGRHLHLAAGDTSRPRSGTLTGGGVSVEFGDIIIQGGGADPRAIAHEVRREVAAAVRDAIEGA